MGDDVEARTFTRADRTRYRQKVRHSLDVFARMLREARFDTSRQTIGCEIELNLVDERRRPGDAQRGGPRARSPTRTSRPSSASSTSRSTCRRARCRARRSPSFEDQVRAVLNSAEQAARGIGAQLMMIGILPTLQPDHLDLDTLTANPRYRLLNEQIFAARGEDMPLAIDGPERLRGHGRHDRAGGGLHQRAAAPAGGAGRLSPRYWNAAQAIAGVADGASGANSPFLFGKELWRETRIAAVPAGHRHPLGRAQEQGVRPRVWFGERWITSIFDLFEENVRYFPALLPICDDEDPAAVLDRRRRAALAELRLHNGTVYRWNRPVYDVVDGEPHLRVENRVLPAGPTVVDMLANAAFYYGLVRALADDERPVWTQMSFDAAEENFHAGARHGIDARVFWPGLRRGAGGRAGAAAAAADGRTRGWPRWGVDAARARPAARASSRRGASPGGTARPGRSRPCTRCEEQRHLDRPTRCAR